MLSHTPNRRHRGLPLVSAIVAVVSMTATVLPSPAFAVVTPPDGAVADVFAGSVGGGTTTIRHEVATGRGTMVVDLAVTAATSSGLSIVDADGQTIAKTAGYGPTALSASVMDGTYAVVVVLSRTKWRSNAARNATRLASSPYSLTVTHPRLAAPVYDTPASIPADCSRAVEAEIMAWLQTVPDGAVARFPRDGCFGQDDSITVADRTGLVIDGNGSTFKALTLGHPNRRNWRIRAGRDITLRNMTVRGSNALAGANPWAYNRLLEWQHGYSFEGTQTALLDSVQAYNVYGDFVEAHHDERVRVLADWVPSRDITVQNSRFERNGRMGIGLTNVDGFVLRNSYLGGVRWSAIDLELDVAIEVGRNVEISGNTFGPIYHSMFANWGPGGGANVGNVTISNNTMLGPLITCESPVSVVAPAGLYRANFTITDNRLLTWSDAVLLSGARNVTVARNVVNGQQGGGGCSRLAGVGITDSHDVTVTDNAFNGAWDYTRVDAKSTNVQVLRNTR